MLAEIGSRPRRSRPCSCSSTTAAHTRGQHAREAGVIAVSHRHRDACRARQSARNSCVRLVTRRPRVAPEHARIAERPFALATQASAGGRPSGRRTCRRRDVGAGAGRPRSSCVAERLHGRRSGSTLRGAAVTANRASGGRSGEHAQRAAGEGPGPGGHDALILPSGLAGELAITAVVGSPGPRRVYGIDTIPRAKLAAFQCCPPP